jgi:TATA-binding protein-associated factor Taf7
MEEEELPLMLRLASISSDWEGNEDEGQSEDYEGEEEEEEETVPSITAQEQERRRKKNILVDFIHELLPKAVAAFHEDQEQVQPLSRV